MALSANQLFLARDRVRSVLEAHLESKLALERANNIAQVLVFEVEDPVEVTLAMLRNEPIDDIDDVVRQVVEAWREKQTHVRCEACMQGTIHAKTGTDGPNPSRHYSEIRQVNGTSINKKRRPSRSG